VSDFFTDPNKYSETSFSCLIIKIKLKLPETIGLSENIHKNLKKTPEKLRKIENFFDQSLRAYLTHIDN